jgi:hypothetical protein
MNHGLTLAVALLGTLPLQANAADLTEQRQELLKRLHAEREEVKSNPHSVAEQAARPDLTPLVGLDRNHLASSLGAPDYCDPPQQKICSLSSHWAYFFYPWEPTARESSPGKMEVRIPMGGWAVEVDFSNDGVVNKASWVKEQ